MQFDGFTWIPSIFLIKDDGMLSLEPHHASLMDNFPIELKLPGSFFFWGNCPWDIALQFLVNAVKSSLFSFWGYDILMKSRSLLGFSFLSSIFRILILKMESLSTRGSNIGALCFSLNWAWSVDCTPRASSFLRWTSDNWSQSSSLLTFVRMYPSASCTTVSREDLFRVFSFLSCSCL